VTLDANGGSCQIRELLLAEDGCYGNLPEAVMEGYVFLGWFTAKEAGTAVGQDTLLVTGENHTLYAQWKLQTEFTVTFDPNGGRVSPYMQIMSVTVEQAYGTMPEPIREGYRFLGWYTQPEEGELITADTVLTEGKDHVLYAHWEYDAESYWTYVLRNRVQNIPQCRRVVVYLEKTSNYKTYLNSTLLAGAGAINPAEVLKSETVTDEWIMAQNPYVVIKLTTDIYMGIANKLSMEKRIGEDWEIYVFPISAINGIAKVQMYYQLQLAKILYPEYFADIDLNAVAKELGLRPKIHY
jgi:uncharacterized repeat protein (TIGR02543 family)